MCIKILEASGNVELIEEIKEEGIGAEFHALLKTGKQIESGEFMRWQFAEG